MRYEEKLKLPQWQAKRLTILQRDEFTCTRCNIYGKPVHAHHLYYVSGKDPWEYPDKAIITLCDECHKHEHDIEEHTKEDLFYAFKNAGFTNSSLIHIILGLKLVNSLPASPELTAASIGSMFARREELRNVLTK